MRVTEAGLAARRRNALLGGKPRGRVEAHTLEMREARRWVQNFVNARLSPIFEMLYAKAIEGDILATKELLDRSWGKATQGVEVSGKDGNPIVFMPLELIQKHSLKVIEGEQTPLIEGNVKQGVDEATNASPSI